jgi:hypothetical protein
MEMPTAAFWMQIPRTAGLGEAPFDHLPGRSSNRRPILVIMLSDRDRREPRGGCPLLASDRLSKSISVKAGRPAASK